MENQTRYDLNAAIENWRQELAAQANLTAEVRRELEAHLIDAIVGFQRLGLDDEESFWLARRRVGQPSKLDEEFVKANPTLIWRKRVLWMAGALLAVALWSNSANIINWELLTLINDPWKNWPRQFGFWYTYGQLVSGFALRDVPIFIIAFFLLRGTSAKFSVLESWFQSRSRLIRAAWGWLALNEGFRILQWGFNLKHAEFYQPYQSFWSNLGQILLPNLFATVTWPIALLLLISWLTKPEERKTSRPASA